MNSPEFRHLRTNISLRGAITPTEMTGFWLRDQVLSPSIKDLIIESGSIQQRIIVTTISSFKICCKPGMHLKLFDKNKNRMANSIVFNEEGNAGLIRNIYLINGNVVVLVIFRIKLIGRARTELGENLPTHSTFLVEEIENETRFWPLTTIRHKAIPFLESKFIKICCSYAKLFGI